MSEEKIDKLISLMEQILLQQKEMYNAKEAAAYLGVKTSWIYKLVHERKLAFYKIGGGKMLAFERKTLDEYIKMSRYLSNNEMENQSDDFIQNSRNEIKS
ncbi:MAG: helix-turn-helix domain-containing protein [Crocinitomicaceae bacterium]